jgi:hypothetical protein
MFFPSNDILARGGTNIPIFTPMEKGENVKKQEE